jgi:hypothetical protein
MDRQPLACQLVDLEPLMRKAIRPCTKGRASFHVLRLQESLSCSLGSQSVAFHCVGSTIYVPGAVFGVLMSISFQRSRGRQAVRLRDSGEESQFNQKTLLTREWILGY